MKAPKYLAVFADGSVVFKDYAIAIALEIATWDSPCIGLYELKFTESKLYAEWLVRSRIADLANTEIKTMEKVLKQSEDSNGSSE